jgi:hypothetical protein
VAGDLLDDEDVSALRRQVRDAVPPEIVRTKRFHTGFAAAFPQNVPDPLAAQATMADAAGFIYTWVMHTISAPRDNSARLMLPVGK